MQKIKRSTSRWGFTLVELLMVLGVITILIAILLPVIAKVRLAAKDAETKALLGQIQIAIEAYGMADLSHSYPGPFSTDAIAAGTVVAKTGNENLVLGLCGGLNSAFAYDVNQVGKGAMNLNPNDIRNMTCYVDARPNSNILSAGSFKDDMGIGCTDSVIPEFIDAYDTRLPILYLRARKGVAGVVGIGPGTRVAYELKEITPYTTSTIGGKSHGLQAVGVDGSVGDTPPTGGANAFMYLKDPNTPSNTSPTTGVPRSKDGFILISAGPDRIYGTADDICIFGSPRND